MLWCHIGASSSPIQLIKFFIHHKYNNCENAPRMLLLLFSHSVCLTLCDPTDCYQSGFSVRGISQARIQDWVAMSFSRGSFWIRVWTYVLCLGRQILYPWATGEPCPKNTRYKITDFTLQQEKKKFLLKPESQETVLELLLIRYIENKIHLPDSIENIHK